MYMNHILDMYIEKMPSNVEREIFYKGLDAPGSILDIKEGLMTALQTDFVTYALSNPDPQVLHERRIAFVAVVSFIDSFDAALKKYYAGTHLNDYGTSKDGGVQG